MLSFLNYEVRDIGVQRGLADRVPDDAAMVMILGSQRSFLEAEKNAIREYLDRGRIAASSLSSPAPTSAWKTSATAWASTTTPP